MHYGGLRGLGWWKKLNEASLLLPMLHCGLQSSFIWPVEGAFGEARSSALLPSTSWLANTGLTRMMRYENKLRLFGSVPWRASVVRWNQDLGFHGDSIWAIPFGQAWEEWPVQVLRAGS